MKTKMIIILSLTLMSFMTFAQSKKDSKEQNTPEYPYYWQVDIKFDLPTLDPEAIQIAWLNFDPIDKFKMKFDTSYLNKQLKVAKDDKEKQMEINSEIEVTWDFLFDVVKGNELYLLSKTGEILSQCSDSPKPKTKKWLVSKVFFMDNKPYAFAVPFELENGSKKDVKFDKANLISLTDLYNKLKK